MGNGREPGHRRAGSRFGPNAGGRDGLGLMPFEGDIDSLPNGTLILSIGCAFLTIILIPTRPSWRRGAAAGGAVFLLAVLAAVENGPMLLVGALALSALANGLVFTSGRTRMTIGLSMLVVAYLAIAAMFLSVGTATSVLLAAVLVVAGDVLRFAQPLSRARLASLPAAVAGWIGHYAGMLLLTLGVLLS